MRKGYGGNSAMGGVALLALAFLVLRNSGARKVRAAGKGVFSGVNAGAFGVRNLTRAEKRAIARGVFEGAMQGASPKDIARGAAAGVLAGAAPWAAR